MLSQDIWDKKTSYPFQTITEETFCGKSYGIQIIYYDLMR